MFSGIRDFTGSWEGNSMNMQVNDAVQINEGNKSTVKPCYCKLNGAKGRLQNSENSTFGKYNV
jgi:hypothetical protein